MIRIFLLEGEGKKLRPNASWVGGNVGSIRVTCGWRNSKKTLLPKLMECHWKARPPKKKKEEARFSSPKLDIRASPCTFFSFRGEHIQNSTGKFSEVKLYHLDKKEWVKVTVDEFVPCMSQNGMLEPACARPLGEEIWVPLLEKAIAKLLGDLKKTEDLFFFEIQRFSLKGPFGGLSDAWVHRFGSTVQISERLLRFVGGYGELYGGMECWVFNLLTGEPGLACW